MKTEIRNKLEELVLTEILKVDSLDSNDDNYVDAKKLGISTIKEVMDILANDEKISNDYELNKAKQLQDDKFNNMKTDIEGMKIKLERDIENRKINLDEIKNNNEYEISTNKYLSDKNKETEARIDRLIKLGVDGLTILAPIILYNTWMKKGFEFEENGSITSNTFKGLIGKFKPTK